MKTISTPAPAVKAVSAAVDAKPSPNTLIPTAIYVRTYKPEVAAARANYLADELSARNLSARNVSTYYSQYVVAGVYLDTEENERLCPNFYRLLDDIKDGKVKRVVCRNLSSFGRSALESFGWMESVRHAGGSVYFSKENLDSERDRRTLEQMLSVYVQCAIHDSAAGIGR